MGELIKICLIGLNEIVDQLRPEGNSVGEVKRAGSLVGSSELDTLFPVE